MAAEALSMLLACGLIFSSIKKEARRIGAAKPANPRVRQLRSLSVACERGGAIRDGIQLAFPAQPRQVIFDQHAVNDRALDAVAGVIQLAHEPVFPAVAGIEISPPVAPKAFICGFPQRVRVFAARNDNRAITARTSSLTVSLPLIALRRERAVVEMDGPAARQMPRHLSRHVAFVHAFVDPFRWARQCASSAVNAVADLAGFAIFYRLSKRARVRALWEWQIS